MHVLTTTISGHGSSADDTSELPLRPSMLSLMLTMLLGSMGGHEDLRFVQARTYDLYVQRHAMYAHK